jgi:hypothetical protein
MPEYELPEKQMIFLFVPMFAVFVRWKPGRVVLASTGGRVIALGDILLGVNNLVG